MARLEPMIDSYQYDASPRFDYAPVYAPAPVYEEQFFGLPYVTPQPIGGEIGRAHV